MKSLMQIGSTMEKETIDNVASYVEKVFSSAKDNNMDQETVKAAIDLLSKVSEVKHVTVQNCNLKGDRTIKIDTDKDTCEEIAS